MTRLRGACRCGALAVAFSTAQAADALQPRACDCAFCTAHGAAWLSDPAGTLAVEAAAPPKVDRHGSGHARFLSCGACGALVAVVDDAEPLRGAVNARCLDEAAALRAPVTVSPRGLSPGGKRARWRQLWTPASLRVAP